MQFIIGCLTSGIPYKFNKLKSEVGEAQLQVGRFTSGYNGLHKKLSGLLYQPIR